MSTGEIRNLFPRIVEGLLREIRRSGGVSVISYTLGKIIAISEQLERLSGFTSQSLLESLWQLREQLGSYREGINIEANVYRGKDRDLDKKVKLCEIAFLLDICCSLNEGCERQSFCVNVKKLISKNNTLNESIPEVYLKYFNDKYFPQAGSKITFLGFWEEIKHLITIEESSFLINTIKHMLLTDTQWEYDNERLKRFVLTFFGSMRQFNSFNMLNAAINLFNPELLADEFPLSYSLTLTSLPEAQDKAHIQLDDSFRIHDKAPPQLLSHSTATFLGRNDRNNVIVIGRHNHLCLWDVPLPGDANEIDYANAALFNGADGNVYVVDLSIEGNVGLRIHRSNGPVPLEQNMRIRISQDVVLTVSKIETRCIQFEHSKGPLTGTITKFSTKHGKTLFIIGKGGKREGQAKGVSPDLFIPSEYKPSTHHATVECSDGNWSITDENSTNGTFILLKSSEEVLNKEISQPMKLFSSDNEVREIPNSSEDIVMCIGNYIFYCKKH